MSRDYSLASAETERAMARGLADADWYRPSIRPDRLRALTSRHDARAARDVVLYLVLLVGSGVVAYMTRWSWWSIPAFAVYGTLYGSSADPRWHECGHGTAFRSDRLNTLIYYPASFMLLRDPTAWRWSHVRHHSDTIVVGRDPEIILPRPPRLRAWLLGLVNLPGGLKLMARTVRHATGRIADGDLSYLPDRERPKVVWEARAYVAVWLGVVGWCALIGSPWPLLFVVGPSFYGAWLMLVFGTTQHLGLREDVLDHRLNTRTMYLNPVLRFLYWNMNYHCEHHLFPTVPFHALPDLHREIGDQLPAASPSLIGAYRELVPVMWQQRSDPTYDAPRLLPFAPEELERSPAHSTPGPAGERGWIDAGPVVGMEPGDLRRVDDDDRTFVIYRVDDRYLATDGICTHGRRVHLAEGSVVDGQVECPKHNGRFDIASGRPTRTPACEALATHEVRLDGGHLMLRVSSGSDQGET